VDNETALFLYRWIVAIAAVGGFGWLTCGILRVARISEANHIMLVAMVNFIVISMIITMILKKRKQVRDALTKDLPETGPRTQMARNWHRFAIGAALFLWFISSFNLFLGGVRPGAPGIQTLLIIPLYFLLDWLLRQILSVVFGIASNPEDLNRAVAFAGSGETDSALDTGKESFDSPANPEDSNSESPIDDTESKVTKGHLDVSRLNRIIGGGLRIALALSIFLYLLEIWGIDVELGRAVTRSAVSILMVVLICYVAWELISAAIQRRLRKEIPEDDDDEKEEGGAGGSRIGTLLLLLRKFMLAVLVTMGSLIILSSMGINIGPLIAGAGVIGLAIGFGAQTLVKDIIAGVFFLIDDAFRVGDYIETAGTKGMVEHISLRSLRMRHPRGMVNTIPFGDIGIVTNMSRDYIITKLDFRVRYDTDVNKVRKIIKKKVYDAIMKNEELGPKLLGKIKSQGVRQMDDSAMIMRVKYKTIPGEQFVIRKEVYRLMQEAFREEGIEFAHRNVTVYLPPEFSQSQPGDDKGKTEAGWAGLSPEMAEAVGAAAALAASQAEETGKKPKK